MAPFIAKLMQFSPSTPEKIARKIHKVICSNNPPLRVSVTIDAFFFGLIRKLLPRKLYHLLMYYTLPSIYRWGEDDHYHFDAEYERTENQKLFDSRSNPKLLIGGANNRERLLNRNEHQEEYDLSSSH